MSVSRETDVKIAKLAGWRVQEYKNPTYDNKGKFALCDPSNNLFVANALKQVSIYANSSILDLAPMGERDTEDAAWNDVPYFTRDISSALTLIDTNIHFELSWSPRRKTWLCEIGGNHALAQDSPYPALSVCMAWLAYQSSHSR